MLQHLVDSNALSCVDVLTPRENSCTTCALMLRARSTSCSSVHASLLRIGAAETRGVRGRICDHAGTSERPLLATACAWNTVFCDAWQMFRARSAERSSESAGTA